MTQLDNRAPYKPLDFGAYGVTGSIDRDGRMIALNSYHPQHGYVTLTCIPPFREDRRYDPAVVRAYRAALVHAEGFGLAFNSEITARRAYILESGVPRIEIDFANGGHAEVITLGAVGGAIQRWRFRDVDPHWVGQPLLQRCAYTQLTEGGPVIMPPTSTTCSEQDGILVFENTALSWVVAVNGLQPAQQAERMTLTFGLGRTADVAISQAVRLARLRETATVRLPRSELPLLLGRGLNYSLMMAIPVGEGICLLTDHMILPLSWNRDSYYTARALLGWQSDSTDLVRRHLVWLFELAERPNGVWARCYQANGKIKDAAFQLDQQLFPLLELAEYTAETGDRDTFERLKPHIAPLLARLNRRKHAERALFPTDETPADDPIALPYHLSSHVLFWRVADLLDRLGVPDMRVLADELRAEIDRTFIAEQDGRPLFAYAADGGGNYHFYHDANDIPLALMPAWGMLPATDPVWRATVDFAFSEQNAGAFSGHLGSLHTRAAWPLGDIQELIIARAAGDSARESRVRARLSRIAQWDGALPEAYDAESGEVVSRPWFVWPNAAWVCIERGVF